MIYCILQVLYLKYAGLGSVCSKVSLTIKLNEKCVLGVKTHILDSDKMVWNVLHVNKH